MAGSIDPQWGPPPVAYPYRALRAGPAVRKDGASVRQPYPPRFYGDVSRGIKGCRWLMERAIETNNRNSKPETTSASRDRLRRYARLIWAHELVIAYPANSEGGKSWRFWRC